MQVLQLYIIGGSSLLGLCAFLWMCIQTRRQINSARWEARLHTDTRYSDLGMDVDYVNKGLMTIADSHFSLEKKVSEHEKMLAHMAKMRAAKRAKKLSTPR